MDLINVSTNWLFDKPLNSFLFVRDIDDNEQETNPDIEFLLENYENCVKLNENKSENQESIASKLFVKTKPDNESSKVKITSFSILCSSKAIEVHGDHEEYLTTISNTMIEETDDLSMFRNDYDFAEPQEDVSLTFKGFKTDLWIYALLLNIKKVKPTSIPSNRDPNLTAIMNIMSMFGKNPLKANLQTENCSLLSHKLSKLTVSEPSVGSVDQSENYSNDFIDPAQPRSSNSGKHLSDNNVCQCKCHSNYTSHQNFINSKEIREYIDKKFTELETSIDNKFSSLENKMMSFLSLYLNK